MAACHFETQTRCYFCSFSSPRCVQVTVDGCGRPWQHQCSSRPPWWHAWNNQFLQSYDGKISRYSKMREDRAILQNPPEKAMQTRRACFYLLEVLLYVSWWLGSDSLLALWTCRCHYHIAPAAHHKPWRCRYPIAINAPGWPAVEAA